MKWGGEIVGHRGAAGVAPENTMASFEAAIASGADRIELDVRRTIDGQAAVFHDLNVDRFVHDARGRSVSRHSLQEMKAIDVGAALGRPGCFVPSLDDVLEALKGRVLLNVEVKGSGADGLLTVPLALDAVRRHGMERDVVLSTVHEPVLRHARAEGPDVARAYIVDSRTQGDPVASAVAAGCEGLHPQHALASAELLARCRQAGFRVRCWTANEPADVLRLMELGVDGIVSDFPGRVRELRDRIAAP